MSKRNVRTRAKTSQRRKDKHLKVRSDAKARVKVRRLLSHIEGMASFQKALNKVVSEAIISGIVDYKPQVLTKGD